MSTLTLVRVRILIYTLIALGTAWTTTMAGVKWDSMGWESRSCTVWGILISWGTTMFAFFDKAVWKLDEEKKANGNGKPPPPAA